MAVPAWGEVFIWVTEGSQIHLSEGDKPFGRNVSAGRGGHQTDCGQPERNGLLQVNARILWLYGVKSETSYLQLCSSFSGLLWLFDVFCDSIQILELFVLVLCKIPLKF